MPNDNTADGNSHKADKKDNRTSNAGLLWILFVGGIVLVILLFVSIAHPSMSERVKFFTVNVLSVLVLFAIIVQAYIYRRQWEAMDAQAGTMQGQLNAMTDALAETRKMVAQNERAVAAAERNVKVAEEAASETSRAMLLQQHVMQLQHEMMREQTEAFQTSAKAAERGVQAAQEAFYIEQRAYVGIKRMTISNLCAGQCPTLTITWINGGKTPAWRFRSIPHLVLGEQPTRKGGDSSLVDDFSDISVSFISAGEEKTVEYPVTDFRLTEEMVAAINGTGKRLYALAECGYIDIKGTKQHSFVWALYDTFENGFVELEDERQNYYPN